jgi:gamma-carbonic anhydrase
MILNFEGKSPSIPESAFIVESACLIGDVSLGEEASVWFNVVIRGDVNSIRVGHRSNIQDGSVIHVTNRTHPTILGDDVTVGHNVTLHGCTIGNRCLIGIGAVILDGAEIGDDCLIAAGSLVAPGTRIPAGSLALGSPAKVKRPLNEQEIAHLLQSAGNYLEYVERYRNC